MFFNHKQWQREQIRQLNPDDEFECPDCDGEGEVFTECTECGHEHEEWCARCDGGGHVAVKTVSMREKELHFGSQRYIRQIIEDASFLAQATGLDIYALFRKAQYLVGYDLALGCLCLYDKKGKGIPSSCFALNKHKEVFDI